MCIVLVQYSMNFIQNFADVAALKAKLQSKKFEYLVTQVIFCFFFVGKIAIEQAIEAEYTLKSRTWRKIKDYCRNQITKSVKQ